MSEANILDICRRIAVERPYFAFSKLFTGENGEILGEVQREHPLGYECSPLGAAEIGRHLAILGSCAAAAESDDTRRFYLATRAEYQRIKITQHDLPKHTKFLATARVEQSSARTLSAKMTMQIGNDIPFVSLYVEYRILSEPLFQRLFAHLAVAEKDTGNESPYTNPIPLSWSEPTHTTIVAQNGGLPPHNCAGHFRGYPAWPVAIIVACMLRTVEKLLQHVLQSPVQWLMDNCTVEAFELVAAATPVTFSTTYLGAMAESQHKFICVASAGNEMCARVVTAIRVVASDVGSVDSHIELAHEISESG